jgi:hypothetical protein
MTSTEPGPSRAPSPPLPEILGRPARIATEPHAVDPWARVLAAMTGALRDEVIKVRTTEEARIDEGWALLHQATERCRLLDHRAAERREQARKEAEEIRASTAKEAEEALANARESARGILARGSPPPSGLPTQPWLGSRPSGKLSTSWTRPGPMPTAFSPTPSGGWTKSRTERPSSMPARRALILGRRA